jgi:hypothetical protein
MVRSDTRSGKEQALTSTLFSINAECDKGSRRSGSGVKVRIVPCLLCTRGKWPETLLQDRSDPVWSRVTVDTPAIKNRFPHAQVIRAHCHSSEQKLGM